MKALYNLFVHVYGILLHLSSPFHKKASLWVKGRRHWAAELQKKLGEGNTPLIWMHCASLGEFEQGRPLLEEIRKREPGTKILLTFFSPSGYEVRKDYSGADHVCYLPLDTTANARKFLDIVQPDKIFFIKYEFWFNFLSEIQKRHIRAYLVSAIFRPGQHFFKWYGEFARKGLNAYTHIFVQDEDSKAMLSSIGYNTVTVAGDTRFDRVHAIAGQAKRIELLEEFKRDEPLLVAGSTWEADEDLLCKLDTVNFKLVIVPHEITESHIRSLLHKFSRHSPVLFSSADKSNCNTAHVLIIDNIGMLSSLYRYATVAYVGGGFGKGIHNVLEPAVFGMPVLFGPNYLKFREASGLIHCGGGFSIASFGEMEAKVSLFLRDAPLLQLVSAASKYYVKSRTGATKAVFQKCIPE